MTWSERVLALARRLRVVLRPPRRLRVLRAGGFLISGTLALGLATLNTGNNLLYLLMGALLGTIALSGWLSEHALRDIGLRRSVPRAVTAGTPAHVEYSVRNGKPRLPSHGLELRERLRSGSPLRCGSGYVSALEPGASARVRVELLPARRGVYALEGLVLATLFPFGLFAKERDVDLPGTIVVWPRTDRPVRTPRVAAASGRRVRLATSSSLAGERGEYRGLREYRPGDDPRDIHWRTTARRGQLMVREYDREAKDEYWIVLDTVSPTELAGETAIEVTASIIAAAATRGDRFGLAAGSTRIPPGSAAGRVEAALDVLAAVIVTRAGPMPTPPVRPRSCVLVTARGADATSWGDVFLVAGAELER
jgi:uncharacterized protein (DUF58 family)